MKNEVLQCPDLTYLPEEQYNWISYMDNDFNLITKTHAEGTNSQAFSNLTTGTDNLLSVPLYIIIIIFMIFTVTMSCIYMYHWVKFNLNDPFIKNFSILYFIGLCALLIPLIFNLIN